MTPKPQYDKDAKQWYIIVDGQRFYMIPKENASLSIHRLAAEYLQLVSGYRPRKAMQYLCMCGDSPESITPAKAKWIQGCIIGQHCRKESNRLISECRRFFRWASAYGLTPSCANSFAALFPARYGKEKPPISVVPDKDITAVLDMVSPVIRDLIQLQLLSAARPGELCSLCSEHIDHTEDVWVAVLPAHKTAHRGKSRALFFGPEAQSILRPYLVFSASGIPIMRTKQDAYRQAIYRACIRLKIPVWSPNRLRHNAATMIQAKHGIDATRAYLGHASVTTTDIYTERDWAIARHIAKTR